MTTLRTIRTFTATVKAQIERYTLCPVSVHIIDGTMVEIQFGDREHRRYTQYLLEGFENDADSYSVRALSWYQKSVLNGYFKDVIF